MHDAGVAGADCVLNSLAGELIAAGIRVVRRGGCFVEIGK
jgi:NADPH:quinone reductase-like Zn-dependent oxidoreductase